MYCIGYDLGRKGVSGWKVRLDLRRETTQRRADKAEFCRLLFHPLSSTELNTDVGNGARAQLKNKREAAFDTSPHTRSHFPLTRAFCQFSHLRARAQSHAHTFSMGSATVGPCLMLRLFARGLFSHFVQGINGWPRLPSKRPLLAFLECVQLTPLSRVIGHDAHKVTGCWFVAPRPRQAHTCARTHTMFAGTVKAHLWGNQ